MAWWTDIYFFRNYLPLPEDGSGQEANSFAVFRRALKAYFYENFVAIIYLVLSFFTYLYLGISIAAFFFHQYIPPVMNSVIDALSEPYLGALAVYLIVGEIERRKGVRIKRWWVSAFAVIWFLFLVAATLLVSLSNSYQMTDIYKTVVTNALAALIIRLGTLLR